MYCAGVFAGTDFQRGSGLPAVFCDPARVLDAVTADPAFMSVTLYTAPCRSYVVHSPTCRPASKYPERIRVPSVRNHSQ